MSFIRSDTKPVVAYLLYDFVFYSIILFYFKNRPDFEEIYYLLGDYNFKLSGKDVKKSQKDS